MLYLNTETQKSRVDSVLRVSFAVGGEDSDRNASAGGSFSPESAFLRNFTRDL